MDQRCAERPRRPLQDLVAALQRDRRQEHAVGQILEAVEVAADADFPLDRLVVRRDVLVVDRPVLAGAVVGPSLEVALAEPQRDRVPQHRLAADAAAAFRIEPRLAGPHRRDLAVGKVERHRMGVEVGARVHARTAFDDGHAHAAAGEVRGERAAGRTGADDDDVEELALHGGTILCRTQSRVNCAFPARPEGRTYDGTAGLRLAYDGPGVTTPCPASSWVVTPDTPDIRRTY